MAIPIPQRTIINASGDPAVAKTEIELATANGGVYILDTTKDIYVTAVEQTYTQQFVTNQTINTITNNPGNIANGVQFNSNGVFASDANFTYNAGTDTLNLENLTISGGIANLGPVVNIRVSGGNSGQVLQTDGAGNLSWVTVSGAGNASAIANGNSNVSIGTANGNITLSAVGNANILTITGTGANIAGTANITGDVIAGGNVNVTSNINGARIQNGNSNIAITANANIVFGVTGNANVFTVDANSVTVKSTNGNLVLGRATATGSPGLSSTTSFTLTANRGNTENAWLFDTVGALNLPNQGVIRNQLNQDVNIVANSFVQLQWTTVAGAANADPNGTTELTNWLYVDADGIHIETNVNNGNSIARSWTFDNSGILSIPQNTDVGAAVIQPNGTDFGLELIVNGQTWTYGTDGNLTTPANTAIINSGNLTLTANGNPWVFNANGSLTVPSGGAIVSSLTNPAAALTGFGLITTANANIGQILNVTGNANVGGLNTTGNANVGLLNVTGNANLQGRTTIGNLQATVTANADTASGNLVTITINGTSYQLLAK